MERKADFTILLIYTEETVMETAEILNRLKAGNQEYITLEKGNGNISPEIRKHTCEKGQHPFAVIVACSDSRVIPEAIFNCGIGELFVIRTAGNTIGENEAGSIEYALDHLLVKAVIVLGHSCCGAVGAALSGHAEGHVSGIIKRIKLAIGNETDPYTAHSQVSIAASGPSTSPYTR